MNEQDVRKQDREKILGGVRSAVRKDPGHLASVEDLAKYWKSRPSAPRPPVGDDLVETFSSRIQEFASTVVRLDSLEAVPRYIAEYAGTGEDENITLVTGEDPRLENLPWDTAPEIRREVRKAERTDNIGLSQAFCAVAESGSIVLLSGKADPTSNDFLVDRHIILLAEDDIVPYHEDAWKRIREAGSSMPRAVNFISGPSSTGDVDLTLQVGVHGPRTLHVVIVPSNPS